MADCVSPPNAAELVEDLRKHIKLSREGRIYVDIGSEIFCRQAADAIEQLLAENAKLKKERDAAVRDLKISSDCDFCKYNTDDPMFCDKSPRGDECMGKRWEWRGVQDD